MKLLAFQLFVLCVLYRGTTWYKIPNSVKSTSYFQYLHDLQVNVEVYLFQYNWTYKSRKF